MIRLLLVVLSLCCAGQAAAETRYVTDEAQIMLRKGQSTKHKIVSTLSSGEAVQELEIHKSSGYSKIQTEDGTTGFVLTRQLQDEPAARDRLAEMEAKLAELQQAPDQLASRLADLQSAHEQLQKEHREISSEKGRLEQELASIKHASANIVQITEERSELRKNLADLTRQIAVVQQENQDLENQTTQRWFMIGAGVVTGGILIGLVLPHLRFRRRRSSW